MLQITNKPIVNIEPEARARVFNIIPTIIAAYTSIFISALNHTAQPTVKLHSRPAKLTATHQEGKSSLSEYSISRCRYNMHIPTQLRRRRRRARSDILH